MSPGAELDPASRRDFCVVGIRPSSWSWRTKAAHFGASGYYTLSAATEGLIGMACTGAPSIRVVPAFSSEAKLGTGSWTFAAATMDARPFLLDMATRKRLARELQL
jgi:LDH2 family malate/lactate/ureidoglycolate dehydrogenase